MVVYAKVFTLFILFKISLGANILYVAPVASPSHHIWNKALAMGLVEKGHNVTMLSYETEKAALSKNFTLITMEGLYEVLYKTFSIEEFADRSVLGTIVDMYEFTIFTCQYGYNTTGFKTLWSYPDNFKFDVILFDATLGRCYFPLIERFNKIPAVAVTPFLLPPVLSTVFGNQLYTSYTPYYSTEYTNKMSLTERAINFIYTYFEILYRNYIYLPKEVDLVEKSFEKQNIILDELERNIGLLLCNTDPILDYPLALPPNIIPVGGLHARPAHVLPKDLKTVMDEAEHGVILFSLGTNVRSDQLNVKVRQALLDAFSKLPQVVLWKFESDIEEELPKNVFIRKWLPQNDIMGHPNTKLFISHGGALSTQEAMYHGIPVIGIPFFGDQHINIRKMEQKKIAKHLDRTKLTSTIIYDTVQEVLNSGIYSDNMRTVSRLYRDQPQTPLEKGIFWIEYVLRHGSVEHLVLPARDMPGYQSSNLDVVVVILLGLVLVYSAFLFTLTTCRFIFSMRRYRTEVKPTK